MPNEPSETRFLVRPKLTGLSERDLRKLEARGIIRGLQSKDESLQDIDESTIMKIIAIESMFNPEARSGSNAQGLMQVKPETADWIRAKRGLQPQTDPYNPVENIHSGMLYIDYLKDKYKALEAALQAYNIGPKKYNEGKRAARYLKKFKEQRID